MVEVLLKYSRWRKLCEKRSNMWQKIIECHRSHAVQFNQSIGLVKISEKAKAGKVGWRPKGICIYSTGIAKLLVS